MIINCPNCSGPVMKDCEVIGTSPGLEMHTKMKCPHCQKMVEVKIRAEIVVYVNGKKVESSGEIIRQIG